MDDKTIYELIEKSINDLHLNSLEPKGLFLPIDYTLRNAGKRLRPYMCLSAFSLFDTNLEKALPAALALEIFHNFTLLHDDLMDQSPIRRGKPTVYKKWNETTAVLSGDAMLIIAYQQLSFLKKESLEKVMPIFSKMALEVCQGQQMDMDLESSALEDLANDPLCVQKYEEMIRLKTSVLIASSLEIGALIASAEEMNTKTLRSFGLAIGDAFQYQDDYLDIYGDKHYFKKKLNGDIATNKKTFLLLMAFKEADSATKKQLLKALDRPKEEEELKIKEVRSIYKNLHIQEKALEVIHQKLSYAESLLSNIDLNSDKKIKLTQLIQILSIRKN